MIKSLVRIVLYIGIACLVSQIPVGASFTVKGVILGHDGKPCVKTHVMAMTSGGYVRSPIESKDVSPDGRFEVTFPESGFFLLMASGTGHLAAVVPLLLSNDTGDIELNIRLRPYDYKTSFDNIRIIGDWNGFDWRSAVKMQKQPDGTFTFQTTAKENKLRYQLIGITKMLRSVNGTQSDDYEFDGSGDFRSVLNVEPGPVTIRFDPTKLERKDVTGLPIVKWISGPPVLAEMWAVQKATLTGEIYVYEKSYSPDMKDGFSKNTDIDITKYLENIDKIVQKTTYPEVKQFALFQKARLNAIVPGADRKKVFNMLKDFPPDSIFWSIMPSILRVFDATDPDQSDYLKQIAQKNPDRLVQGTAYALLLMGAADSHRDADVKMYYEKLKQYKDFDDFKRILAFFNPTHKIKVGMKVPDFKITSLDTGKELTRASFAGKYLLIDFWATWCRPCLMEMATLDAAWKKFGGDKFRILSISFDQSEENVKQFRKDKWKMPWLHGFAKGGFANPISKDFDVRGIPKPILVGPDGTILAMEMDLRGPNLEKTLAKYLKPNQTDKTQ